MRRAKSLPAWDYFETVHKYKFLNESTFVANCSIKIVFSSTDTWFAGADAKGAMPVEQGLSRRKIAAAEKCRNKIYRVIDWRTDADSWRKRTKQRIFGLQIRLFVCVQLYS